MATVLVALDTSGSARPVLDQGAALARSTGGNLCLFHVIEPVASYVPVGAAMDVITTTPPVLEPEQTESARKRLEELAGSIRAAGTDVTCEVGLGMAADEILDQAKTCEAGYVVLGSHGHGALYHLFSGSVVTGVLKKSPCPVLVVPVRR